MNLDSEVWTCRGCRRLMIGRRTPDDLCGPCIAGRLAAPAPGTFAAHCEAIRELEGWPRLLEAHELAKRINRGDFDGGAG
jgi:hypothetical protein